MQICDYDATRSVEGGVLDDDLDAFFLSCSLASFLSFSFCPSCLSFLPFLDAPSIKPGGDPVWSSSSTSVGVGWLAGWLMGWGVGGEKGGQGGKRQKGEGACPFSPGLPARGWAAQPMLTYLILTCYAQPSQARPGKGSIQGKLSLSDN